MDRNIASPRSVRYLLAVAEHRSFTKAADALHISQPALSQQIKQLEGALDAQLVDRTGRSAKLTAAGEIYLSYAQRAVVELDAGRRAIHQLQDLSRGSLQVAMTPVTEYIATPLLENFSKRYPGVALSTLEMAQGDIEAAVAEDRVDLGIAFTNILMSEARSAEIDTHVLFIEALHLVVGNAHPLAAQRAPVSADALEQMPLAMLHNGFALRRHIDLYCLEHGIKPRVTVEAASLGLLMELVRLGRLATVLPKAIAGSQNGLYPVPLLPELPHHTISLICHKDAHKSPACLAFGELASEWSACRCRAIPSERLRPCPLAETCEKNLARGAQEISVTAREQRRPTSRPAAKKARMAAGASSGNSS